MAVAFFENLKRLRRTPGHCTRCGKDWHGNRKCCPECLEKAKGGRASLIKRIESLELAVARIQVAHKDARNRAYSKGYFAAKKVFQGPSAFEPPVCSIQEAAAISHAYDTQREA